MTTNSADEFRAELLRLIYETEDKAEQVRHDNSFVYANYDPTEENKVWEQGKITLLPLMQSKPLWAFEVLFDYLQAKGYLHFYPLQLAEYFIKNTPSVPQEFINLLKELLFEGKKPLLRQASMNILGYILLNQHHEILQREVMGSLIDEDVSIRLISLRIYASLMDEKSIPYLRLLLDDEDSWIRQHSKVTLALFSSPAARMAFEEWREQNL